MVWNIPKEQIEELSRGENKIFVDQQVSRCMQVRKKMKKFRETATRFVKFVFKSTHLCITEMKADFISKQNWREEESETEKPPDKGKIRRTQKFQSNSLEEFCIQKRKN